MFLAIVSKAAINYGLRLGGGVKKKPTEQNKTMVYRFLYGYSFHFFEILRIAIAALYCI